MTRDPHLGTGLTAGAFFLIGTLAVAQTALRARNTSPQASASSQRAGMAVDHQGGNGVRVAGDPGHAGNHPMYEGKGAADVKPGSGVSHSSGAALPQVMQRKHIAGVKYEDRIAGKKQRH